MNVRRWAPPLAWAAIILVLTSIPNPNVELAGISFADKLAHASVYGILGLLSHRAAVPGRQVFHVVVMTVLAVALFGAIDEWHQQFIPGRSMSFYDWVADALGATVGALVSVVSLRRTEPQ